ncbi:MAG TPA: DUF3160 domain-containing protein [Candidatus Peribacteraceae bacterium]|nr:DUF3160 domain-containing protein [Candidatus Peribacteraceae bacterium]
MKRPLASVLAVVLLLSACTPTPPHTGSGTTSTGSSLPSVETGSGSAFGNSVHYIAPSVAINSQVAAKFSTDEATNLNDLEKAYGFTLDAKEKQFLSTNKFLVMNLLDTNIRPGVNGDSSREFANLYNVVAGSSDYKERTQANSVYLSSDVFFNAYNNLYTEILKEMENTSFYPAMKDLSSAFFAAAQQKLNTATSAQDKTTWTEVRNYFAIPYAILSTAAQPLTQNDYYGSGGIMKNPDQVQTDFDAKDKTVDTEANVAAFVKNLHLDSASEQAVLADVHQIFAASGKGVPQILKPEFDAYAGQEHVMFTVDFTQDTPRGTYTSSSLRREYFRAMKWFIDVPFFVKSPQLTTDAFAIVRLLSEHPAQLKDYNTLESAINFLVGRSDDLMPADYMQALESAKGASDQSAAIVQYLTQAHDPMIKSLAAFYDSVGTQQSDDVRLKTKGMRFFSGKFILDSYWTGQLTQGDEAPKPGYTQKLPPYASSLEVMALLGSDYAKSQIPKLDFYTPQTSQAIDKAMNDLAAQEKTLSPSFWMSNIYNGWLWTIKGLFSWQADNHGSLPQFMQSPLWEVKTLQTASAFWTELRHATILYAKQSFAELGGGGPGTCDDRKIPSPPKGYIEPQPLAYARLLYIADRTDQGLKEQGFENLRNLQPLQRFVDLMKQVQDYTQKELSNAQLSETITSKQETGDDGKTCTVYSIQGQSDWEVLRRQIIQSLLAAEPVPTEGPILSAKDRRSALVADVHTGGDSNNPTKILYEGEGVPQVILVAVKDSNGPRIDLGFTYSHYEFMQPYGGNRLTDEDWQKNFYTGTDPYDPYKYTPSSTWPAQPAWYQSIVHVK